MSFFTSKNVINLWAPAHSYFDTSPQLRIVCWAAKKINRDTLRLREMLWWRRVFERALQTRSFIALHQTDRALLLVWLAASDLCSYWLDWQALDIKKVFLIFYTISFDVSVSFCVSPHQRWAYTGVLFMHFVVEKVSKLRLRHKQMDMSLCKFVCLFVLCLDGVWHSVTEKVSKD